MAKWLSWAKQLCGYAAGLFIMALGVSVSKASELGVSPVNSIPSVLSEATRIDMGVCTTLVFTGFILLQILILRREFRMKNLLQILCASLFGLFVSASNALAGALLPVCDSYLMRLGYLAVSMVLVALGIYLYLDADVLSLPGEGVMQAVSYKTGMPLPAAKMLFDWAMVLGAAALSLISMHGLVGVREGTVIAAFGVGVCLKGVTALMHRTRGAA